MKYIQLKKRVSDILCRETLEGLPVIIAEYINEVRDEIAQTPLAFLQTTKNISLTSSTYSYKVDGGTTTSRYSGMLLGVRYDDNSGVTPYKKLDFYTVDAFEQLYSVQKVADPTAFTVKGDNLIVNNNPSVVTSKKLVSNYFMLPDKLANEHDEGYLDLKYYNYIIARTCERIYMEYLKEGAENVKLAGYWSVEAKKRRSSIIMNESYMVNPNNIINTRGL